MPVISGIAAGSVCTLTETDSGANAQAILLSSSVTPGTVTVVDQGTATVAVSNVYDPGAPAPSGSGGGEELADTGSGMPAGVAFLAAVLVASGAVLIARRRARGTRG